ncbi:MAG: hypothetical protein ACRDCN_01925, partial [Tannerellaceae bacterium]
PHSRLKTERQKINLIYPQNKPCKVLPKTKLTFSKNLETFFQEPCMVLKRSLLARKTSSTSPYLKYAGVPKRHNSFD